MAIYFRLLVPLLLLTVTLKAEVFKYTTKFKNTYHDKLAEADAFADLKNPNFSQGPPQGGDSIYVFQHPTETAKDHTTNSKTMHLGFLNKPSTQLRYIKRTKEKLIFDIIYSFDEYSRRIVPVNKKPTQKKFLALFGCSFTQGSALNDDETLAYFIAKNSKEYYPYNYGIGGTGMGTVLALTEISDFKEQIPEREGVFVYIYIEAHPRRSLGFWPELKWAESLPFYKRNVNGSLVYAGSIAEARQYCRS